MNEVLNLIEEFLKSQPELTVKRVDKSILLVQKGEASSPRFIDLSFQKEARIGVSMVVDYLPNATETDTARKFLDFISCPIERTDFFKGNARYKTQYRLIKENGQKELFGTGMTWLIPFWKKDRIVVEIEDELISRSSALKEIERIKTMYNNS